LLRVGLVHLGQKGSAETIPLVDRLGHGETESAGEYHVIVGARTGFQSLASSLHSAGKAERLAVGHLTVRQAQHRGHLTAALHNKKKVEKEKRETIKSNPEKLFEIIN
jgi:hypothetical protein